MSTPTGYNNPAYCHQYDSSLYDYQYVPEIDPDSPDLNEESNKRINRSKLLHPKSKRDFSESDEFEGSDESNGSIIIEECNNRRVTLICEKRSKTETNKDEFYEDGNCRGAYYQDISLESEDCYEDRNNKIEPNYRNLRHQKSLPMQPPMNVTGSGCRFSGGSNPERKSVQASNFKQSTTSINAYQRPQRAHRYEEIPSDDEFIQNKAPVHRYAEISSDENGYPTLTKEIKIEEKECYNYNGLKLKPRATSPVSCTKSPPATPSRTYQRTSLPKGFEFPQLSPNSTSPFIYSSSPFESNSFEMAELSPPRYSENFKYPEKNQTFFIKSPKRQPPIGASAACDSPESLPLNGKCILPKNLQQISKSEKERFYSLPNSPKRKRDWTQSISSPRNTQSEKKITQIFHIKPNQTKSMSKVYSERESNPARRNISNAFTDPPKTMPRSPYKPTTETIPPRTAIITPIFQRKNQQVQDSQEFSPKRNFGKMSQAFQSTGNIFRSVREPMYSGETEFRTKSVTPTRIKRNQSVPNFAQTLPAESKILTRKTHDIYEQANEKYSMSQDLQYSPKKPLEHVSPINKSRISLIDQTKSSWSNSASDFQPQCSTCFIFAAIVHLVTATATCAISFYLFSKIGRRYYLDFGILAGFVNFILGLLGFRSYCWRWLPNRNYVSGFIGLAAFSAFTCAGLTYLITAKPLAGDPILDIMGGAICAVSVLTIVLALTGLTMSGCCKAPPPDNRVTDI